MSREDRIPPGSGASPSPMNPSMHSTWSGVPEVQPKPVRKEIQIVFKTAKQMEIEIISQKGWETGDQNVS